MGIRVHIADSGKTGGSCGSQALPVRISLEPERSGVLYRAEFKRAVSIQMRPFIRHFETMHTHQRFDGSPEGPITPSAQRG